MVNNFLKEILKKHIHTVHEGHKDHKCESCGKSFSSRQMLKKHIHAIHEGHKDYKCESCGKSFSQAGTLKKHIQGCHIWNENHWILLSALKMFFTKWLKDIFLTIRSKNDKNKYPWRLENIKGLKWENACSVLINLITSFKIV